MLTPAELRAVHDALTDYLFLLEMEAGAHLDCDDSCGAKGQLDLDVAEARTALEIIDRELNRE